MEPVWWTRLGGIGTSGLDQTQPLKSITTEAGKVWLKWFLSPASPWAPVVHELNQDVDFAIEHGIVIQPDPAKVNFAYNALIASRFPTEFYGCCEVWYDLVKKGVHPSIALVALTATLEKAHGHAWNNGHGAINDAYILYSNRFDNFACGTPVEAEFLSYRAPASTIWGVHDATTPTWNAQAAEWYPDAFGDPVRISPWGGSQQKAFKLETHWNILLKEQERLGLENIAI